MNSSKFPSTKVYPLVLYGVFKKEKALIISSVPLFTSNDLFFVGWTSLTGIYNESSICYFSAGDSINLPSHGDDLKTTSETKLHSHGFKAGMCSIMSNAFPQSAI